jgi:hypothetical protein
MPRVHLNLYSSDDIEDLELRDDWEELIGVRSNDERLVAQQHSAEVRERRRLATGSSDARQQRRSERRKSMRRGGRHD